MLPPFKNTMCWGGGLVGEGGAVPGEEGKLGGGHALHANIVCTGFDDSGAVQSAESELGGGNALYVDN